MAKKEQAAVNECALQLRRFGDVFNWKYKLLELIVTLKNLQKDNKRWKRHNEENKEVEELHIQHRKDSFPVSYAFLTPTKKKVKRWNMDFKDENMWVTVWTVSGLFGVSEDFRTICRQKCYSFNQASSSMEGRALQRFKLDFIPRHWDCFIGVFRRGALFSLLGLYWSRWGARPRAASSLNSS